MNPVFRLENSEFPGIDELTDTAKRFIYLNFENLQKEMDGEDENCNFDYKGIVNITSNMFEYLGYQVSKFTNSAKSIPKTIFEKYYIFDNSKLLIFC